MDRYWYCVTKVLQAAVGVRIVTPTSSKIYQLDQLTSNNVLLRSKQMHAQAIQLKTSISVTSSSSNNFALCRDLKDILQG